LECVSVCDLRSDLNVLGKTTSETLEINGLSNFKSDIFIGELGNTANINVNGLIQTNTLEVEDQTLLKGNLIIGTLTNNKDAIINGKTTTNQLEVQNQSYFNQDVTIGSVVPGANLSVIGQTRTNTLEVVSASNFGGGVTIGTETNQRNLNVNGKITTQDLEVNGDFSLNGSNVTIGDALNQSDVNINGTFQTLGNSTFGSNATIQGDASVGSLSVTAQSTFSGDITVGSVSSNKQILVNGGIQTNNIEVVGTSTFQGNITSNALLESSKLKSPQIDVVPTIPQSSGSFFLESKKLLINTILLLRILVDNVTPQYHTFQMINKKDVTLTNVQFDFSLYTTFNVASVRLKSSEGVDKLFSTGKSLTITMKAFEIQSYMIYFDVFTTGGLSAVIQEMDYRAPLQ